MARASNSICPCPPPGIECLQGLHYIDGHGLSRPLTRLRSHEVGDWLELPLGKVPLGFSDQRSRCRLIQQSREDTIYGKDCMREASGSSSVIALHWIDQGSCLPASNQCWESARPQPEHLLIPSRGCGPIFHGNPRHCTINARSNFPVVNFVLKGKPCYGASLLLCSCSLARELIMCSRARSASTRTAVKG